MGEPYAMQPTIPRQLPPRQRTGQIVLGLLLPLPALILLLVTYALPFVATAGASFREPTLKDLSSGAWVGFDNYATAFEDGFGSALARGLGLALVPLVLILVLAPLMAWAAQRGGTIGRWSARALLALPLAAYAPTAAAVGVFKIDGAADRQNLPTPSMVYWLTGFGLTVALGVTLYLAALRRRDPARSPLPALVVGAVIAGLSVLAISLQAFTAPYVAGGTRGSGEVPMAAIYSALFMTRAVGPAAAMSTVLFLVLIVLGLAVTLLVVLSQARLEFDDTRTAAPANGRSSGAYIWVIVSGVLVVAVLVVSWGGLSGWLTHILEGMDPRQNVDRIGVNTWGPPLLSTMIGVTVAALAAVGISGLRPFGRHSEWLLLPFGLFLFVGNGPLLVHGWRADETETFLGLVPPGQVAVPALFVLSLLLRGQLLHRDALLTAGRPVPWVRTLLPVVPMLALAYLVTWLVQAQDLLWGHVIGYRDYIDAQTLLAMVSGTIRYIPGSTELPFKYVLPLWALIPLIGITIAAQLAYLDRVAMRVGRKPPT